MVKLTPEQRTFVIKTFYETSTLLLTPGAFQFPAVEECDFDRKVLFDEYVAISHRYGLRKVS